jgi:hypothetical protein
MDDMQMRAQAEHEADLVWTRYYSLIVAHAILLGFVGQLISSSSASPGNTASAQVGKPGGTLWLALGGCIFGMLVTVLWSLITSYGWSLSHAWLRRADAVLLSAA